MKKNVVKGDKTMKKLLTVFCSLCLAVMLFALSACGGSADGTIKGDYKEADAESYAAAMEVVSEPKLVKEDQTTFGLSVKSDFEASVKFDGKSVSLSENETANVAVDTEKEGLEGITAAANAELKLKMDDKFIDTVVAAMATANAQDGADTFEADGADGAGEVGEDAEGQIPDIGKIDVTAKANAYVSAGNVYVDGNVKGISDKLKALATANAGEEAADVIATLEEGFKYAFPQEMIVALISSSDYSAKIDVSEISATIKGLVGSLSVMDVTTVNTVLGQYGFKLYIDNGADGVKIKLATTAEAKTTITALITSSLGTDAPVSELALNKCDIELYVAFDAEGYLTGIALNVNVNATAKVFGKTAELNVKGTANVEIGLADVKLPSSFEGYVNPMAAEQPADEGATN